jgi:predicted NACHT family NTPase
VRQSLAQRVKFQLDLTGHRGDRADAVPLEKCFIVPELVQVLKNMKSRENREIHIGGEEEMVRAFAASSLRTVLLGSPGSGKSTWSRWLQRTALTVGAARLAVLVRLRELTKLNQLSSHQEILREAAGIHLREEIRPEAIRSWCELGKITPILDGFDEVPSGHRETIISWIKELDNAVGSASLIVTSRPVTTDHLNRLRCTD